MQSTEELLQEPQTQVDSSPSGHGVPGGRSTESTGEGLVRLGFNLAPGRIAIWLGAAALALAICHIISVVWHYKIDRLPWAFRGLFDLDEEESFGTWFSSGILFLAGIACMLCAKRATNTRQPHRFHWWFLGFGFCLLSVDEVAGLHESVNTVTEFSWAIPGGILAIVIGLAYLPFLCRIPRRIAVLSVIGGAVYLGGAVGVELATEGYKHRDELNTLAYNLTTVLEEFMEMSGAILFLFAVTCYLTRDRRAALTIDLADTRPDDS